MNKKTIFWTLAGVGFAIAGYYAYKKITAPVITFGKLESESNEQPTQKVEQKDEKFPLKRGDSGGKVVKLQRFLRNQGYPLGDYGNDGVDGIFGQKTESAVKQNQQPFEVFKTMYPQAQRGKVSKEFYDLNVKDFY